MRTRRRFVNQLFKTAPVFGVAAILTFGQPPAVEKKLTLEEVVKLAQAGFSDDLLITKIRKNGKPFDLDADELVDLKKSGISDIVIRYLLDPSQPYTPQAPSLPASGSSESAKKFPPDTLASQVPTEPGLYLASGGRFIASELKLMLGMQVGKSLIKKAKTTSYLVGPQARSRILGLRAAIFVRLPEGKDIHELVLVSMSLRNGRRELDLGESASKPELKADVVHPCDSTQVGPGLYRLSCGKLDPGEYLFLFLGSAEPQKGVYGRGYDFGLLPEANRNEK